MRRTLLGAALLTLGLAAQAAEPPGSATDVQPLPTGSAVPAATVRSLDGAAVALDELAGSDPTILIFYRGGW